MIRPLTMCGDLMRIAALTGILVMFGILGAQAAEKRVAAEEPDGSLSAGFAEVDITPPEGWRHGGGYGEVISTGVHDSLRAKAMVLSQGGKTFILVMNDLLSVPEGLTTPARKRIAANLNTSVDNVVIAATHNHGSPEYWGPLRDIFHARELRLQEEDRHERIDYTRLLTDRWEKAVGEAERRRVEVDASIVVAEQLGLAQNRRFHMRDGSVRFNPGKLNPNIIRPAGPVDTDLPFLLFQKVSSRRTAGVSGGGAVIGALSIFAMHTAVFGGTEFGADFPGVLQANLQKHFGPDFISVFAEGTAGDINHIRARSEKPNPDSIEIGETLAGAILENLPQRRPVDEPDLAVLAATVRAPYRQPAVTEDRYLEAKKIIENQLSNGAAFLTLVAAWRDCHHYEYRLKFPDGKPLEVQAVRLNRDSALVFLPHEIFVELGMAIKASSPFRNTLVVSLSNDVDFYIPTRRAFEEGSYEITTCSLAPGCGELLVETALTLLTSLK
ncbi:MAG: hypothetical protein O2960_19700 [Verrucomicrobia bacterium]|nr:hypothetical protein [Verrucomicrobiota bacterium]